MDLLPETGADDGGVECVGGTGSGSDIAKSKFCVLPSGPVESVSCVCLMSAGLSAVMNPDGAGCDEKRADEADPADVPGEGGSLSQQALLSGSPGCGEDSPPLLLSAQEVESNSEVGIDDIPDLGPSESCSPIVPSEVDIGG